ncbi:MAG: hypothetical protein F6J93_29050 [Oscillatoria sp. SIO1A7]|nr:hypothetical protein [Oscillatoria sp. SIO1A7]
MRISEVVSGRAGNIALLRINSKVTLAHDRLLTADRLTAIQLLIYTF